MKIFVINLERDVERRQSIQKQLDRIQIAFEFLPGVLGSSLTPQQKIECYDDKKAFRNLCYSIVPAHIGCSLSHVNAYRKIIEDKLPFALILEDDVIIPKDLEIILNEIEKVIQGDRPDVILLSQAVPKKVEKRKRLVNEKFALWPYKSGFYASSLIVTNYAAKALVKDLFPINDVADCWPRIKRHKVVDIYVLLPDFIRQDQISFGSSTNIDVWKYTQKGLKYKIKYKICRAFWQFIDIFVALYHRNFQPYKGVLRNK